MIKLYVNIVLKAKNVINFIITNIINLIFGNSSPYSWTFDPGMTTIINLTSWDYLAYNIFFHHRSVIISPNLKLCDPFW
jgi:hypothetical protein